MKIQISLTDFVDFVLKSGPPRLTHVRKIKARPEYHPKADFYKQIRDAIITYHAESRTDKDPYFQAVMDGLADKRKTEQYKAVVSGYKQFLGRKSLSNAERGSSVWSFRNLEISVNPELCLDFGGRRHLIKLYFKRDAPTKNRSDVVLYLLQRALPAVADIDSYAVLDVRNARLITESAPNEELEVLLHSEAAAFITMFEGLS